MRYKSAQQEFLASGTEYSKGSTSRTVHKGWFSNVSTNVTCFCSNITGRSESGQEYVFIFRIGFPAGFVLHLDPVDSSSSLLIFLSNARVPVDTGDGDFVPICASCSPDPPRSASLRGKLQ